MVVMKVKKKSAAFESLQRMLLEYNTNRMVISYKEKSFLKSKKTHTQVYLPILFNSIFTG